MTVIIRWEKAPKLSGPCTVCKNNVIFTDNILQELKIKVTVELLNNQKTS